MTASYAQAAACEQFRARRFDEPVVSPVRGYWFLATPPAQAKDALVVGDVPPAMRAAFAVATPVGAYQNPQGGAPINGRVSLTLLSARTTPWPQLWDELRGL